MTDTAPTRPVGGVRRVLGTVKRCVCNGAAHIRDVWRVHRERLSTDHAYRAALTGVVLAACELLIRNPRVVAVVAAITTAYITIARAVHPEWEEDDWP